MNNHCRPTVQSRCGKKICAAKGKLPSDSILFAAAAAAVATRQRQQQVGHMKYSFHKHMYNNNNNNMHR